MLLWGNGYGLYQWCLVFDPVKAGKYQQKQMGDQALIAFLHNRGLREVYVTDYWRAVPLTFDAEEKIIFAQPYHDRFPLFHPPGGSFPPPGLPPHRGREAFSNRPSGPGGSYKKAGHRRYYDFDHPPISLSSSPPRVGGPSPTVCRAVASAAFDRDLATRWKLGGPWSRERRFTWTWGNDPGCGPSDPVCGKRRWIPRGLRRRSPSTERTVRRWRISRPYWGSLVLVRSSSLRRPGKG